MRGKTHIIGGAIAGMIVSSSAIPIGIAMIGSIIPDIDLETSTISKMIKPVSKVVRAILSPFKCGVHRGITHSLINAVLLGVPLYMIKPIYGYAMTAGVISHIFLDLISGGVCILSPIVNKRLVLGKIKTGSVGEIGVWSVLVFVLVGIILKEILL